MIPATFHNISRQWFEIHLSDGFAPHFANSSLARCHP
jgi:hypothetical protein